MGWQICPPSMTFEKGQEAEDNHSKEEVSLQDKLISDDNSKQSQEDSSPPPGRRWLAARTQGRGGSRI